MADEIKKLKIARTHIKGRLTRLKNYISCDEDTLVQKGVEQLEIRFEKLKPLWNEFNEVQPALDLLTDKDPLAGDWEEFENDFYSTYSKFEKLLRSFHKVSETEAKGETFECSTNVSAKVRLPTIELPKFSGAYDDFQSYFELFISLIDSNPALPIIQKFHFLRSSLKGDALAVIQSLELSEQNYNEALALLKNRYENKRVLINNHLQSLFNLRKVDKESSPLLRRLLDDALKHVRALNSLGQPTSSWDTLLVYIISKKLDDVTRKAWETSTSKNPDVPSLDELTSFMQEKAKVLEVCEESGKSLNTRHQFLKTAFTQGRPPPIRQGSFVTSTTDSKGRQVKCVFCSEPHQSFLCLDFTKLSIVERGRLVLKLNLCRNCLWKGHKAADCKSRFSCSVCKKRHHTLLHNSEASQPPNSPHPPSDNMNLSVSACASSKVNQIILATAVIQFEDNEGKLCPGRVLLDSGSQSSFISNSFFESLSLRKSKCQVTICGLNSIHTKTKYCANVSFQSRVSKFRSNLNFHLVPKITESNSFVNVEHGWSIPPDFTLADPNYSHSRKIDALIGAEVFWNLLLPGFLSLGNNLPVLQNTVFGWVVSGPYHTSSITRKSVCHLSMDVSTDKLVSQFWAVEEVRNTKSLSNEEVQCEQEFMKNTFRDENGRFNVSLPFLENPQVLGNSYQTALIRFQTLERRLNRDNNLKEEYVNFMNDYLQQGHMERVTEKIMTQVYYIPHHPVIKETNSTTKVRVVFDASSKTTSGISLNDLLNVGPTVQRDLFSILMCFRFYKYAFTADIRQMYRQIKLNETDCNLQLILWRRDSSEPVQTYRLKTVTYGTASAPYLAIRSLRYLAESEASNYPLAANVVLSDFYVDDVITGSDNLNVAVKLQDELIALLKSGNFELHKWVANDRSLLLSIPEERKEKNYQVDLENDVSKIKTLGLRWEPNRDIFQFRTDPPATCYLSKRIILSDISKLFDPLGLLAPVIVSAKLIMQMLWSLKGDWDDPVPADIHKKWIKFRNDLSSVDQFQIPRYVKSSSEYTDISLHGFCDASESAYGCALYIKTLSQEGRVHVALLCAKSRIAPLKKLSLPRLELCGALLLSQLTRKITKEVKLTFNSVHLWTDSSVVLAWIGSDSSNWKTFTANRVAEIHSLTEDYFWHHVASRDNPADVLSRGCVASTLLKHQLWWTGPKWLKEGLNSFDVATPNIVTEVVMEEMKIPKVKNMLVTTKEFDLFSRFSSLKKLLHVTAFCLRFIANVKRTFMDRKRKVINDKVSTVRSLSPVSYEETTNALHTLIKIVQTECFHDESKALSSKGVIPSSSKLKTLHPFLDSGLIRVGGRLNEASLSFDKKFPIVLPSSHPFTELIALDYHLQYFHIGPQQLLFSIRQRFWPLRGKDLVKRIVRLCVRCARVNPKPLQQLMGNLPAHRVTPQKPFTNSGVDLFGPFTVKRVLQRSNSQFKAYGVIFVCLATKAIHLEIVCSLKSDDFIAVLKRFIGRRGIPLNLYCDNATNFVGAKGILKELVKLINKDDRVTSYLTKNSISWHFIPPRSPNFGGLWEAAVKSVKYHIKRVLGSAMLNLEELYTLFVEVEACVNSRPLLPMSEDPSDLLPLTPGHFLIGGPLHSLPEPDLQSVPLNRLSRWQLTHRIKQAFWRRWSQEYLSTLQERKKWNKSEPNLQIGTLVVLKEDFRPPLQWSLGRVIATHPGKDGLVRVATVRTAQGIFKRAISKICPLPVDFQTSV